MKIFTQRYESSWLYYCFFKIFGGIALGALLVALAVYAIYGTEPFLRADASINLLQVIVISLFAGPLIYVTFQFSVVKADKDGLRIHRNGKKQKKEWNQVKAIQQMPFCTPPVYRISFYEKEKATYVSVFSWVTMSVGFWSWDFTDFKENIQHMIHLSETEDIESSEVTILSHSRS